LISISQGKQIAGRAGRYGTQWENGLVTTFQKEAVQTLRQYLKASPGDIESAGLSPRLEQLEKFSEILPGLPLGSLLERFEQLATVSGDYFLCNIQQQIAVANMLDNVDMSFADKYVFLQAPVNIRDEVLAGMLLDFATSHGEGTVVNADRVNEIFRKFDEELARLEVFHRGIMLYLWLANRFPETFHEADKLVLTKLELEDMINKKLVANIKERRNVTKPVEKVNVLKQLLPNSPQKVSTIKMKVRTEDEY
jgi:ATP-dependent RNA helicase SUPV3L1/SUV3